MAGAEGQGGLDLDAAFVGRDTVAVVAAMYDEAAGRHRYQIVQAGPDPVLGLDDIETHLLRDGRAGGAAHELAHQRLIRLIGEMQGDVPASVRPLERGHRRVTLEEDLGQNVDDLSGRGL